MTEKYLEMVSKNFIEPSGENRENVSKLFNLISNELIDYLSNANSIKLLPDQLTYHFPNKVLNQKALNTDHVINEIKAMFDHSMNAYSPYYIGHMDSMSTIYSFLGDMLASAINNNMFSLEMSPFLTQLEYKIIGEFCQLFGYDSNAGGLILGGGSLANLQALVVARNYTLQSREGNVRDCESQLVIICSQLAHVSIKKSAMIMGLGSENVVSIPVDEQGHINPILLNQQIEECINSGKMPMAVVATMGTTVTGNIDQIEPIAKICKNHNVWLHADAIWGGGLILSNNYKDKLKGIQLADSITFNPQKWMMVAKTCSLILYKNYSVLEDYFRVKKDYVREHDIVTDLSEIGIAGTKRADVLKLWLSIKGMGMEGYELFVDRSMEMIKHFTKQAEKRNYIKIAFPPETAMICMRSEPVNVPKERWNDWNSDLQEFLLKKHNTFVSLPKLNGNKWLRIILLNPYLTTSVIDNIFNFIDEFHQEKK